MLPCRCLRRHQHTQIWGQIERVWRVEHMYQAVALARATAMAMAMAMAMGMRLHARHICRKRTA